MLEDAAVQLRGPLLHGTAHVHLGPQPFAPVAVEVSPDQESALVAMCVDRPQLRPAEDDGNRWPNTRVYRLEVGEDGHRRVVGNLDHEPFVLPDGSELTPEYCDDVEIPRAVFDPEPDLETLSAKSEDDVIPPSPSPEP